VRSTADLVPPAVVGHHSPCPENVVAIRPSEILLYGESLDGRPLARCESCGKVWFVSLEARLEARDG